MAMTKEEFKARWESDADGGGITFDDIADCAIEWGLYRSPKTRRITEVANTVLVAAGCKKYYDDDEDDDN